MVSFKNKIWQVLIPLLGPILFAVYPVLALYAHNVDQLVLTQACWPLIFSLILASLCFGASRLILKSNSGASISTMLLLIIFWNYMLIYSGIAIIANLEHWHLLPLLIFIYFHLLYFLAEIKQRETLINLNLILLIPMILLIFINLTILIPAEFEKGFAFRSSHPVSRSEDRGRTDRYRPDIYLIILDEYASLKTIGEEWGYDNGPFAEFLKGKGFFVPRNSEARYSQTIENMASLLNMEYITEPVEKDAFLKYVFERDSLKGHDIIKIMGKRPQSACFQMMSDNYLMKYLKDQGYRILFLEGITQHYAAINMHEADITLSYQDIKTEAYSRSIDAVDAFFLELIRKSAVFSLDSFFKIDKISDRNFNGTRYILNYLKNEVARTDSPKFVYAHIMCPHDPYVFDQKGKYVSQRPSRPREGPYVIRNNTVNKAYLDQYIFMTNELKDIVDTHIQRNKKNNPIFIIQSDHGPRPHHYYLKDKTNAFQVFNAVFFPDGDYGDLYDNIAPVNTLRVILNKYFGENYDMLQDR